MVDTLRRWGVIVFFLVIFISIILSGILSVIVTMFPNREQPLLPYFAAIIITGVIANFVVMVMGWFGISPMDLLPPQTLEERLKKQNLNRFLTSKISDENFLAEQAKAAENNNEYDWMYLFAQAWVALNPNDPDALEMLSHAYFSLKMYEKTITVAEKLLEREKLNYRGFSIIGKAYFELGDLVNARKYTEEALTLADAGQRRFSLADLVDVYEAQADLEKATASIRELLPLLDSQFQRDFYNKRLDRLERIRQTKSNQALNT